MRAGKLTSALKDQHTHIGEVRMPKGIWEANELRALAEHIDSIRNREGVLIEDPADDDARFKVVDPKDALLDKVGVRVVLSFATCDEDYEGKRLTNAIFSEKALKTSEGETTELKGFDAVFTSLSAIEKFVLPYYARMCTADELAEKRNLYAKNMNAVAVLHTPKSVSSPGTVGRGGSFFMAVVKDREELLELEPF